MNEIKLIYGDSCSKCHQLMNILPKWCEEHNFLYSEENRESSIYKDEIETLPLIVTKTEDKDGTGFTEVKKFTMEDFIANFMPKW